MGADGHVYLYDGEAIIKDGKKENFFKFFCRSVGYDQGIFLGKRIFTVYGEEGTFKRDLNDICGPDFFPGSGSSDPFKKYFLKEWKVWT